MPVSRNTPISARTASELARRVPGTLCGVPPGLLFCPGIAVGQLDQPIILRYKPLPAPNLARFQNPDWGPRTGHQCWTSTLRLPALLVSCYSPLPALHATRSCHPV